MLSIKLIHCANISSNIIYWYVRTTSKYVLRYYTNIFHYRILGGYGDATPADLKRTGIIKLYDITRMHNISKTLCATSKFWAPEEWYEAIYTQRAHKY